MTSILRSLSLKRNSKALLKKETLLQVLKVDGVKLEAVYACLPDNDIDNLEACKPLYGDGAVDVVKGTGIKHRSIVSNGTSSLDLCLAAASRMIGDRPQLLNEIKGVLCVTFTPERPMPGNAIAAQYRLGLDTDCLAFDINLACSGYGYGLWIAATMARQTGGKILLLDGDVQSTFVSPYDKATMPVLSDAGTASLIGCSSEGTPWFFSFMTDGSKRDVLTIPAGGSGSPVTCDDLKFVEMADGSKRRRTDIAMDGFEVFKFVAQTVSKFLSSFIKESGISKEKIEAFVPHQANIYMVRQLAKKIEIPDERVWISGDKFGNSGSSTIPVTIASEAPHRLTPGAHFQVLVSGFGAGLSISAGIITIDSTIKCSLFRFERK